jgi:peroxiredoxin
MLTLVPAAPQIRGVFARTAPEARGDWHQARTWRRLALAAALLLGSLQFAVWAADTTLRPWTDDQLPLFSLDTIGGGHADLAQLRGRVVLVHFFATWCEPCRAELTALQDLAGRLRERSVSIVAIDAGETDSRVNRFFASLPVSFPVLLDRDQATTKAWQVYAPPTTFCSTAISFPASWPKAISTGAGLMPRSC